MLYAAQIRLGRVSEVHILVYKVMEYSCFKIYHGVALVWDLKWCFFLKSLGGGSGSAERTHRRRTVDSKCPKANKTIQGTLENYKILTN